MKYFLGALLSLFLAVPASAQYSPPGVAPGADGDFGDVTLDLGLFGDGAVGTPSIAFSSDTDTGIYHEAVNEINFASAGAEIFESRYNGSTSVVFQFISPIGGADILSAMSGTANEYTWTLSDPVDGGTLFDFRARDTDTYAGFGNATHPGIAYLFGTGGKLVFDADQDFVDYLNVVSAGEAGTNTITLPDLTGTVLLAGVAQSESSAIDLTSTAAAGIKLTYATGSYYTYATLDENGIDMFSQEDDVIINAYYGNIVLGSADTTLLTLGGYNGIDLFTNGPQPTCDSAARGRLHLAEGGAGVADVLTICMKDAGDAYAWETIASGQ
jgi:hypothetical protein